MSDDVPGWFDGFEHAQFELSDSTICARFGGAQGKPPLLLLHGFPQSHVMWHRVAQELRDAFFLVMPDLRGYGDSSKAPGKPDHSNYSKRAMAQDMAELMTALGHERFLVCAHDRGARVSHRLALDHAERVLKLCVLDIVPTYDMYMGNWGKPHAVGTLDGDPHHLFARTYYHWFHLIQPAPLPEKMIGADARFYLRGKLGAFGSAGIDYVEPRALEEYERCFCRAEAIHTACEDYRAGAGIDLQHDEASRARGEKVRCDMLVLWGERGLIGKLWDPLVLWQAQCEGKVTGEAVPSGHFIPEELPQLVAGKVRQFMS